MKLNADRTQLRRSEPEPELNIFLGPKGTHTQTPIANNLTTQNDRTQTLRQETADGTELAKDKIIFKSYCCIFQGVRKTVTL